MKTDELIGLLAAHPEPVDPARAVRGVRWAAVAGLAAALPLMVAALGLNPDLAAAAATAPMFWVKVAFTGATAAIGVGVLQRLARPGLDAGPLGLALALPVLLLWLLAGFVLLAAPPPQRLPLVLGATWRECPLYIALLSVPAFIALIVALRALAPTRLRRAGAAAGLIAGALGACAYQLHCPEMDAPFLAVWYVLGMLAPAAAGAWLGPRLLRW
jgi:hypothetical protein